MTFNNSKIHNNVSIKIFHSQLVLCYYENLVHFKYILKEV